MRQIIEIRVVGHALIQTDAKIKETKIGHQNATETGIKLLKKATDSAGR